MSDELFTLRPAAERDWEYLNSYTYAEGMDHLPSLDNVTVAVNDADEPVGFIRIAFDEEGTAYVNPVVVHASWRGYHVGQVLVDDAQAKYPELRLVSRGSCKPFYDKLGFEDCSWDLIGEGVSEDCAHCTMTEECKPQPMRRFTR